MDIEKLAVKTGHFFSEHPLIAVAAAVGGGILGIDGLLEISEGNPDIHAVIGGAEVMVGALTVSLAFAGISDRANR